MKFTDVTSWLSGADAIFGLEVYVNKEQNKEYRLVHISKKNGSLISDSFFTYTSIDELLSAIPTNSAVALVWNGKGVIHRMFPSKEGTTSEIAKTVFPDIKSEDFLCQQTKTVSGGILSLLRKEPVNELLALLEKKKVCIVAISIGPFGLPSFFQLLSQFSKEVRYDYYHVQTNSEGIIIQYEVLPENASSVLTIADEKIEGIYVNAFSAACLFLLTPMDHLLYPKVDDELVSIQIKKYKEFILKRRGGFVFLIAVLLILLLNFSVFSNLRKANSNYQDQLTVSQFQLKRLDSLENFIKTKKEFLEKAGWIEKVIVSKECDEIAQTVPAEIRLTELTIHPVNVSESRNAKETIFTNKKIIIRGVTKKVVALNDWLKVVGKRASIKGLHMEEYHFDTHTQEGQFKLEGEID